MDSCSLKKETHSPLESAVAVRPSASDVYDEGIVTDDRMLSDMQYLEMRADAGPCTGAHYHSYIEMLYGIEGEVQIWIGDGLYTFSSGDLVIIGANEVHSLACITGSCRYHVLKFLPETILAEKGSITCFKYLLPFVKSSSVRPRVVAAEELGDWDVPGIFSRIRREYTDRAFGYELAMRAEIIGLFIGVLRIWEQNGGREIFPEESAPSLLSAVQRAMTAPDGALLESDAQAAAKASGLSYSYFSRSFKKITGMSYSGYIEMVKIRESEKLLITTDMSVTEVAAAAGFSTTSYFIVRFKAHHSVSPREFRSRYKKSFSV